MTTAVLILGAGGREHALASRLVQYTNRNIIVSSGNAGIAQRFECVTPRELGIHGLIDIAKRIKPDLVIVGPEDPLANGIVDALQAENIAVFGPTQACAQLEASKGFMKEICSLAKVPTAASQIVLSSDDVDRFFANKTGRYVVKADGLCAGKGVTVCDDVPHAISVAKSFLGEQGKPLFGSASSKVLVEEFLTGKEISVIGICDGDDVELFAPVRDHKRLLDGDMGPNTGGMGVVGPVPVDGGQRRFLDRVKDIIFLPVLDVMRRRGTPYKGFLYAGLMVEGDNINLLEFNVRLGDPEAQALLYGTDVDLYPICHTIATGGKLKDLGAISLTMRPTAAVVMACEGYPEAPRLGDRIEGFDKIGEDAQVFFAGVKKNDDGHLVTGGGRVLSCVASGDSLALALEKCYRAASHIHFRGAHYRRDIGRTAM